MIKTKTHKLLISLLTLIFFTMILPLNAMGELYESELSWDGNQFLESSADDGTIGNSIIVTAEYYAWFTGDVGTIYTLGSDYAVNNLPEGLEVKITKLEYKKVKIELSGKADHHYAFNSIDNLGICFLHAVDQLNKSAELEGRYNLDLKITYTGAPVIPLDPGGIVPGGSIPYPGTVVDPETPVPGIVHPELYWNCSEFYESPDNDGSIATIAYIQLCGGGFTLTGANNTSYTNGVHFTSSNVPPGLHLKLTKMNDYLVRVSLTGNALDHGSTDSINNMQITILPPIAADNSLSIINDSKSDLTIHFYDPQQIENAEIVWSDEEFTESINNPGFIGNRINLNIVSGHKLKGANYTVYTEGIHYNSANLPAGLSIELQKFGDQVLRIGLIGNAANHEAADSINNLQISLLPTIIDEGVQSITGGSKDNLKITFADPAPVPVPVNYPQTQWLGGEFLESNNNDGTISSEIYVSLTSGHTFSGTVGYIYPQDFCYSVSNIPSGLDVQISKYSDTSVKILLTGTAVNHEQEDSITNLSLCLLPTMVIDGEVITNGCKNDIKVTFSDSDEMPVPPVIEPSVIPSPDPQEPIHAEIFIGTIRYQVNGDIFMMDVEPYIANDRTYVPVRYLAYALGITSDNIDWDPDMQIVTIADNETTVKLRIGHRELGINNSYIIMDVAPEITNDRTMLPARWVAEALGAQVGWEPSTKKVTIDK